MFGSLVKGALLMVVGAAGLTAMMVWSDDAISNELLREFNDYVKSLPEDLVGEERNKTIHSYVERRMKEIRSALSMARNLCELEEKVQAFLQKNITPVPAE
ncbi:hypothetical protein AVT69_gp109 [Pseudomonas phage PhiPA3]|uniref:Uncharacterized protein 110 n=1 Tax=Pseudomonas phage PhiPA3 TaxID=998086 RepID=F8SJY6_BPPA3|nr:hypothetical protein AVT69_gp109 [Pseudomonas phage PhiPA3]AEH03534.1 hypothetical protein [Pseudomonas phage PhiPA3]